jgi:hypothetical protein
MIGAYLGAAWLLATFALHESGARTSSWDASGLDPLLLGVCGLTVLVSPLLALWLAKMLLEELVRPWLGQAWSQPGCVHGFAGWVAKGRTCPRCEVKA